MTSRAGRRPNLIPGPLDHDPVFGPPCRSVWDENESSDRWCPRCEVAWSAAVGGACWVCGYPGRHQWLRPTGDHVTFAPRRPHPAATLVS